MDFTMTDDSGPEPRSWTGAQWMALAPAERLRLISTGRFTYARTGAGR